MVLELCCKCIVVFLFGEADSNSATTAVWRVVVNCATLYVVCMTDTRRMMLLMIMWDFGAEVWIIDKLEFIS